MKSLILTLLYLAKDTVHRWFTRISSPLSRVLVVFFLTLSALASLGGYVISTNVMRDKIIHRGGSTVMAILSAQEGHPTFLPTQKDIETIVDADSYALTQVGTVDMGENRHVFVYTPDFSRLGQVLPLMAPSGQATMLQSRDDPLLPPGPADVEINRCRVGVFVRSLPEDHPILMLMRGPGIIIQREEIDRYGLRLPSNLYYNISITIRNLDSSEPVQRAEKFLRTFLHFEGMHGSVYSALSLLKELDVVLSKQTQCRLAFCIGISCIVGILLTALAGMEYRQNEYIYTLMKSFGIHPILLVGAFIFENIFIVGLSFAGAIAAFMYFQRIIVTQILKLGHYSLSLQDILPEIALISYTLLGCILVSSTPIFVAANRQIGRVLK